MGYNSENTKVLATYEQRDGNKRMLLLHEFESGRLEYVVGSNFTESRYDGALGYERYDYSWDYGHYFNDVVEASLYWSSEVLCTYPIIDEREVELLVAAHFCDSDAPDRLRRNGSMRLVLRNANDYLIDEIYGESDVLWRAFCYGVESATGKKADEYILQRRGEEE